MLARRVMQQAARRAATASSTGAGRRMAHGHAHAGDYPFGMHFHVSPVHKNLALAYGTMLWLWVFYRAKQDGAVVLGFEHPWDHGHGHHASPKAAFEGYKGRLTYERAEIGALPTPVLAEAEDADEHEDDE